MKKSSLIFLLFAPWLFSAILVWVNYKPTIQLWPTQKRINTYSDSTTSDKGNSGIRIVSILDNKLVYEYSLGNKFMFAYVGISFNEDSSSDFLDLSSYDYLAIEFEANRSQRVPVVLTEDVLGYSKKGDGATYRPLTQTLEYDKTKRKYLLPLSDFETPSWWYTSKHTTESKVGKPNLSRIHFVQFHNCQMLPKNVTETSIVYSLSIHKDMQFWWWLSGIIIVIYYLIWVLIGYLKKKSVKIFPRKQLIVNNLADEESKKVLEFIALHYSNPELSTESVQKEVGISEAKLSAILKASTYMSFKRYLNHIRIEEAKRLLYETDRQVMDIAYLVGYGNISHFNRVFKEAENCSPNEFRKIGK